MLNLRFAEWHHANSSKKHGDVNELEQKEKAKIMIIDRTGITP